MPVSAGKTTLFLSWLLRYKDKRPIVCNITNKHDITQAHNIKHNLNNVPALIERLQHFYVNNGGIMK